MNIELKAYTGAGDVGGNAYLLEAGETRVLFDCGTGSNQKPTWVRDLPNPDACWIGHAHLDHVGALPDLIARFPALRGLATETTKRLAGLSLATRDDVDAERGEAAAGWLQTVAFRRWRTVQGDKMSPAVRLMPFRAGHLPGAASCLAEIEREGGQEPCRVFYTGDFCCHDLPATPGAQLPRPSADFSIDVLVMEGILATDRDADEVTVSEEVEALVERVRGTEGACLIGVQTLAESAEVAAALQQAEVDFAAHNYCAPVLHACADGSEGRLNAESIAYVDLGEARSILRAGGCVIAAGDQFKSGTPAGQLVVELIDKSDAAILCLNRAYGSTPVGRLLNAKYDRQVKIAGYKRRRRAHVERFRIPNHAPRWQLLGTVKALAPKRVVLVHGKQSRLYALKRAIEKSGFDGRIDVPENGEALEL